MFIYTCKISWKRLIKNLDTLLKRLSGTEDKYIKILSYLTHWHINLMSRTELYVFDGQGIVIRI